MKHYIIQETSGLGARPGAGVGSFCFELTDDQYNRITAILNKCHLDSDGFDWVYIEDADHDLFYDINDKFTAMMFEKLGDNVSFCDLDAYWRLSDHNE